MAWFSNFWTQLLHNFAWLHVVTLVEFWHELKWITMIIWAWIHAHAPMHMDLLFLVQILNGVEMKSFSYKMKCIASYWKRNPCPSSAKQSHSHTLQNTLRISLKSSSWFNFYLWTRTSRIHNHFHLSQLLQARGRGTKWNCIKNCSPSCYPKVNFFKFQLSDSLSFLKILASFVYDLSPTNVGIDPELL